MLTDHHRQSYKNVSLKKKTNKTNNGSALICHLTRNVTQLDCESSIWPINKRILSAEVVVPPSTQRLCIRPRIRPAHANPCPYNAFCDMSDLLKGEIPHPTWLTIFTGTSAKDIERMHSVPRDPNNKRHGGHVCVPNKRRWSKFFR